MNAQQYWASRHPYKPIAAPEMAERFKYEFHVGIAVSEELSLPIAEEDQLQNVSLSSPFAPIIHILHQGVETSFLSPLDAAGAVSDTPRSTVPLKNYCSIKASCSIRPRQLYMYVCLIGTSERQVLHDYISQL